MTVFVVTDAISKINSYPGLIDAIAEWLDRSDINQRIPDFINLAEARFRRVLVMPDMETEVAFSGATLTALPADFDSMRSLVITSPYQYPMSPMAPADFYGLDTTCEGPPRRFMIAGPNIKSWPTPDQTYTGLLSYRAKLPSLGPVLSNWLLAAHPDAYLYASLVEAEGYLANDERIAGIKALLDEKLDEIMMAGQRKRYGGGPIVMRPAVHEELSRSRGW